MLDYRMRSIEDNKLAATRTSLSADKPYLTEFRPTVDEFSVQQIKIEKADVSAGTRRFAIPGCDSASILIVVEGDGGGSFEFEDATKAAPGKQLLDAKVGFVFFLDANTDVAFVAPESKNDASDAATQAGNDLVLLAYRAYCDIKS